MFSGATIDWAYPIGNDESMARSIAFGQSLTPALIFALVIEYIFIATDLAQIVPSEKNTRAGGPGDYAFQI